MHFLNGMVHHKIILVQICGIALIALGVIYKVNSSGIDFMSLSSLAIAIGAIISLIAFFGCCGAIKESSCMLTTYAAIVLTLFIIQVVLAILAFVAIRNEGTEVSSFIRDHLTSLYNNQNSLNLETLEVIHRGYECCGLDGPTGSEVQNNTQVMSSCCSKTVTTCTTTIAFQKGCVSAMTDFLNTNLKIIGIIAIVFAVVELLCSIFAFYVRNTITSRGKYV